MCGRWGVRVYVECCSKNLRCHCPPKEAQSRDPNTMPLQELHYQWLDRICSVLETMYFPFGANKRRGQAAGMSHRQKMSSCRRLAAVTSLLGNVWQQQEQHRILCMQLSHRVDKHLDIVLIHATINLEGISHEMHGPRQ